jgi:hypothetical protein
MKTFKPGELKTFEQLASLSQGSLKKVLSKFLSKHYKKVVETDDYIFAEGDIPIALVAHMDTVFKLPPDDIYYDERKNVMWSPDGLGADDRAGVYAIVTLIREGFKPHIIFTTDEEIGAAGAIALSRLDCPFSECKYIIQLDRRGSNDCVFYDCDNQAFVEYVEQFGFEWNYGTFTDISRLCPAWKIAGVNLSVGYKDEHSVSEVLFVGQLLSTIAKVRKMLQQAETAPYFEYVPAKYNGYYGGWNWETGYSSTGVLKCSHCHKYFMEEEMFPVVMQDQSTGFFCPDCLSNEAAWCTTCNSAFEKHSPEQGYVGTCPLCSDMKEKKKNDKHDKRAL